jgi:hypothetical protein
MISMASVVFSTLSSVGQQLNRAPMASSAFASHSEYRSSNFGLFPSLPGMRSVSLPPLSYLRASCFPVHVNHPFLGEQLPLLFLLSIACPGMQRRHFDALTPAHISAKLRHNGAGIFVMSCFRSDLVRFGGLHEILFRLPA